MKMRIYGLSGAAAHAAHGGKRCNIRCGNGVARYKRIKQKALALLPNALDPIQFGKQGRAHMQAAMVGNCKAVCLIPDALKHMQRGIVACKHDRLRLVRQDNLFMPLRKADGRDMRKAKL